MSLQSIEKAKKRIEEIKKNRVKEEADIADQIRKLEEDLKNAEAAAADAVNRMDVTAYKKANAQKEDARIQKEMYEARRDTLKASALISDIEYNNLVSAIMDEVKALGDAQAVKMARIAEDFAKAAAGLRSAQQDANACLRILQHDIYRDADRPILNKSTGAVDIRSEKKIDIWDIITWIESPILNDAYTTTTGKKADKSNRPGGITLDGVMITG